ncbi:unnamed protein product [Heterobilharzia americana]|nr:unnamed protein product [Heterobilharzia americana]
MDRLVRKINTSPKSKRKTLVQTADNFGVPLKVLLDRDSVKPVPRIVKNICEYLLANGLSSQGIFRINGSAKLIEALKSTFQISAAEDLSSLGNVDIYALAGVLKLFLRELPEGLVSEKQGVKCIKVAKEYASDENMYIFKLQTVLCTLVHENYELLKYLCRFLNKIAENEPVNKMSHNSLGIIFGPCVFRCSLDVQVLKNQGLTNYVMTSLIRHPDSIFVHHPKSDFFVLDRLFKLPEIVSSSALPNLEDRVQSSCDAFRVLVALLEQHLLKAQWEIKKFNSDAEVFFNRTPDQRTLDITNIITSIATCSSPEEFHFQPQSDSCFNTSCRISSYNSKSDYISKIFEKSLYSYDAVSGLPSRRLSESSKFGKSVHSTYDTDNSTELRRISNQQKCTSNEPGVHPINTWNSMPSVQKTTETLLDSMNTSISIKDKTLNQFRLQSPIPESITPNSLECHMNSCDCPSSVDVILQPNVTQNCNSMEREDDLPHLIYLPTPSIDTDHLILEISENDRDLIKPFTNAQPSPGNSQTSLTQAIDHCLDAHMFSFFKQQVSNPVCHSDSVPHSQTILVTQHFLPNETDNHVVYSTREVKDQQKRSPLSTRHSFDYTTVHTPVRTNSVRECKKYNQSAPASPILLGPTSLPKLRSKSSITEEISKPLKSAIYEPENRRLCTPPLLSHFLDSTVEHREAALNHQKLSNRISSIKTPSHFKLSTGKKSPITDIDTSEATLFSTRNKPSLGENESSIALHSNSCISAVKLVRSFSLNDTSSIKFRPLLRKFSSTSSKSVLNDICKTSVGDNDGNDNLTLKQSNSTLTSLESFYDLLSAVLSEQRRCCGRPEHLSEMNWDQIEQEKFDIQKGLLYFEGLYGRPKSPKSKRIMKPIYERYRQVKRLVSTRHSCVPGFSSEFPFGRDLSHFKTPIKNPVTGVDNEKWTDNQLPLIVSDDLMKILGIPTRTSEALLEDNIHNMDSDSDLSLSQYVYKCEKSKLPGGSEQRDNKLLKSSDNYNMLTEDNESKKFALKSSHRRSLMRPNDREIQLYYRQIYSLPPLEMYKEKKNILLKKHILQTELIDYENNIQRLLGRKPTKAEREPMRDKFELYSFIKRQLKAVDSRLNFCSSDLINIQGDSNNSVEQ